MPNIKINGNSCMIADCPPPPPPAGGVPIANASPNMCCPPYLDWGRNQMPALLHCRSLVQARPLFICASLPWIRKPDRYLVIRSRSLPLGVKLLPELYEPVIGDGLPGVCHE